MDPVQKIWMFQNWLEDQNDDATLAKNHAYLLGSFWNPDAVKDLMGDGNVYESTEEDFEESIKIIRADTDVKKTEEPIRKRRARILKD